MEGNTTFTSTNELYQPPVPISMRRTKYWVDEIELEENAIYINLDETESDERISSEDEESSSKSKLEEELSNQDNLLFVSDDTIEIDLLTFLATEKTNLLEV